MLELSKLLVPCCFEKKHTTSFLNKIFKKYVKKNKFFASTVSGLDTLFVVQGGKDLHVDNSSILDELQSDAKKSQIQSAFKKASKGKLQSRIMLNKFIENIAA